MAKTPLRNLRVPDELWAAAKARADMEGTTLTAVLVKALKQYVMRRPPRESNEPC